MDSSQSLPRGHSQSPPPEPSPSELGPSNAPPEDVLKILLATDNHLGYAERDPVRGNDSLRTFEEILQIAQEKEVDMILLGGDLFHDSKPTVKTIHGTMNLLRKYCMGDRPSYLEYLSDGSTNFSHQFNTVNYMDPNYNVGIPVFSIHGNHDDPTGDASLASLDLLSVAGLVNYFGRQTQVDDITISPVLLRKGETMLSLYGLGNVRDERLHRTFLRKKVQLLRPEEYQDDWFNLMVVHQNRVPHGRTNYLPETFLDPFLHLVLWGHEHECLIDPVFNTQQEFYVTQPGSSIATALSEGEAKKKHVAVLKIFKTTFEVDKIPLRTVRPFLMADLILSDVTGLAANDAKGAHKAITKRIEELIEEANDEWLQVNPDEDSDPPLPLIRLRVEYTGFSTFNPQQFGQQYVDKVANPRDMVMFFRKRKAGGIASRRKDAGEQMTQLDADGDVIMGDGDEAGMHTANVSKHLSKDDAAQVEQLIQQCLGGPNLLTLPETELSDAIKVYVEKNDNAALGDFVDETGKTIVTEIARTEAASAGDDAFFTQTAIHIKTQRNQAHGSESSLAYLMSRKSQDTNAADSDQDEDSGTVPATKKRRTASAATSKITKSATTAASTRGRGKGRATAASTRGTTAASRKRKQVEVIDSSEEEEAQMSDAASEEERDELASDDDMPPPSKARGKAAATTRSTRASARASASAAANKPAAAASHGSQTPTNGSRRLVQTTLSFAPSSQASSASSSVVTATPTNTSQRGLPSSFGVGATRGGRGGRGRGKK